MNRLGLVDHPPTSFRLAVIDTLDDGGTPIAATLDLAAV
jgi:hypothetical protein